MILVATTETKIKEIEKLLWLKIDLWNNESYTATLTEDQKQHLSKLIDNLKQDYALALLDKPLK